MILPHWMTHKYILSKTYLIIAKVLSLRQKKKMKLINWPPYCSIERTKATLTFHRFIQQ